MHFYRPTILAPHCIKLEAVPSVVIIFLMCLTLLSYNVFSLFVGYYYSLTYISMSFQIICNHFHLPISELRCGSIKIAWYLTPQGRINSKSSMTKLKSIPLTSNTFAGCGFYILASCPHDFRLQSTVLFQSTNLQLIRANIFLNIYHV